MVSGKRSNSLNIWTVTLRNKIDCIPRQWRRLDGFLGSTKRRQNNHAKKLSCQYFNMVDLEFGTESRQCATISQFRMKGNKQWIALIRIFHILSPFFPVPLSEPAGEWWHSWNGMLHCHHQICNNNENRRSYLRSEQFVGNYGLQWAKLGWHGA